MGIKDATEITGEGWGGLKGDSGTLVIGDGGTTFISEGWGGDIGDGGTQVIENRYVKP